MRLPRFIQVWFALDLLLALLPPIHWSFGVADRVLGLPLSVLYLSCTGVFIAASVVSIYVSDPARAGER